MKTIIKWFAYILIFPLITSCLSNNITKERDSVCDKRYVPITQGKGEFLMGILSAMGEKAYAGYSLGYSEQNILQILKSDFHDLYIMNQNGETKNLYIDLKMSCSDMLNQLYSPQHISSSEKLFLDSAKDSMVRGQKKMLAYKASKKHAEEILSLNGYKQIITEAENFEKGIKAMRAIDNK